MNAPISIPQVTLRVAFAVLALTGLSLAAMSPASASIKPKNGAYIQYPSKAGQAFGYVTTQGGKIAGGGGSLAFRDKSGKSCVPEGLFASEGKVSFTFVAKRKVRPDRRNRFTISVKPNAVTPTLRGRVSGKMISRNRASLKFSLSAAGCRASGSFGRATYVSGG